MVDPDDDEIVENRHCTQYCHTGKVDFTAGARGHLDELEASFRARLPHVKIRKSETDTNVFDTRRILQYARLLMPLDVSQNESAAEKLRAYKNQNSALQNFQSGLKRKAKNSVAKRKYDFCVNIAPSAIEEYEYWERHDGWNGHRVWEETKKGAGRADATKQGRSFGSLPVSFSQSRGHERIRH